MGKTIFVQFHLRIRNSNRLVFLKSSVAMHRIEIQHSNKPFFSSSLIWMIVTMVFGGIFQIQFIDCHLFTSKSVGNVEMLFDLFFNADLEKYLSENVQDTSSSRIEDEVISFSKEFNNIRRHVINIGNAREFFSNPINEYLLVRRLAEWDRINQLLNKTDNQSQLRERNGHALFLNQLPTGKSLPKREDVKAAAIGLIRLQIMYQLNTQDMAEGVINFSGIRKYSMPMNAGDCWEMGRQSYMIGEFDYASSWMKVALHKYDLEKPECKTAELEHILEFYAFSTYKQGQFELTSNLTKKLLALISPKGEEELKNNFDAVENLRIRTTKSTGQKHHDKTYMELCRGKNLINANVQAQLQCDYYSGRSPWLQIQPVKREEIYLKPNIFMFHDMISDRDIERIQRIAAPNMEAGKTRSNVTEGEYLSQRRVAQSKLLDDDDHVELDKLTRRIDAITGIVGPRKSNVVSYGIGGHFAPHTDFVTNEKDVQQMKMGNNLATCLIYLNEVDIGGSTVFTIAKTRIKPIKGSVAFWFNLNADGEGDPATTHASCPILSGTKWVITKLFNSLQQPAGIRFF